MVSTTWLSELPSCAAAWCAAARSVWSILIVRCGRSPFALASRRRAGGYAGWRKAVQRTLDWVEVDQNH
jgi:hypothetical protein